MIVTAIKTKPLLPPQDNLLAVIDELDLALSENSVLALSSKVVAIHQGRSVPIPQDDAEKVRKKDELIKREAERYLERNESVPWPRIFTIYEGTLCSSSGIDASNGNGFWTLLPKNSSDFAAKLREHLCHRHNLNNLGVIIIDSRGYPMRNGTIGMTLGYAGFNALYDYRGHKDIFGKEFAAERINIADCLASTATLAMGEGSETTPLCVIKEIPHISFTETEDSHDAWLKLKVPMDSDVFAQFYKDHSWQPGGGQIS